MTPAPKPKPLLPYSENDSRVVDKWVDSIINNLRKERKVKPFSIHETALVKRLTDLGDEQIKISAHPTPPERGLLNLQMMIPPRKTLMGE